MKKAFIAAILTALTLCSCGNARQTDIKEDYKEFFDYAFDGKYSISGGAANENGAGTTLRTWQVSFTDGKGEEQLGNIIVITEKDMDEETVKAEYDKAVYNFVKFELGKVVEAEMGELLSAHFEITDDEYELVQSGDGFSVYIEYYDCAATDPDNTAYAKRVARGSGVKYAGAGLREWAVDRNNALKVTVVVNDVSRTEEFEQRFAEFDAAFLERTESPKNYCLVLKTYNEDGAQVSVAADCRILGEESDADSFSAQTVADRLGTD